MGVRHAGPEARPKLSERHYGDRDVFSSSHTCSRRVGAGLSGWSWRDASRIGSRFLLGRPQAQRRRFVLAR